MNRPVAGSTPAAGAISWRNTLDCRREYGHITRIIKAARSVGYEYFVWNGRVYRVIGELLSKDTGILASEL